MKMELHLILNLYHNEDIMYVEQSKNV